MLDKLCLLVLMCGYLISADPYETNNDKPTLLPYADQKNENNLRQPSLQPLTFNEINKKLLKNCKQGSGNDRELIPTYTRRVVKPSVSGKPTYSVNTDLVPQSLKDGDFNQHPNELKSENVLQYAPNQLLNVYVDRNEETQDNLVGENNEKLFKKVTNEKDLSGQQYLNDNQNEKHNSPKELFRPTYSKYPVNSKNLLDKDFVDSSLSSDEGTSSEKCLKVKLTSSQDNTLPAQSRRYLSNELPELSLNNQDNLVKTVEDSEAKNNYELMNARHSYKQVDDDVLADPTTGLGVSRLTDTKMMLMENSRVCYACTSAVNPTCLFPDRRTTVKYCRKGHDSCVTKTYLADGNTILIRDCASSCDVTTGIAPKYKSCAICHSDLCNDSNGAYSISSHNLAACLMIIYLIKWAF